jgi:hypothetical protein
MGAFVSSIRPLERLEWGSHQPYINCVIFKMTRIYR